MTSLHQGLTRDTIQRIMHFFHLVDDMQCLRAVYGLIWRPHSVAARLSL